MDTPAVTDNTIEEPGEAPRAAWIETLLGLLVATCRHIALLAAWIATCGSLFMSEVLGWLPCLLCWYQRILMYPLALILTIGILRRDGGLHQYVLPFSIFGSIVSLYHYLLIKTAWFPPPPCTVGPPCTVDYLDWFGFINIPFLALTAFLIITVMMTIWMLFGGVAEEPDSEVEPGATQATTFDGARLAVVMIIVSVVLSFMIASTGV